jgi:hypothetical protein
VTRLRGLAALVFVVAFVVGVPWALVRYGNWPITGLPSIDSARDLADTAVSDTMVFAVLTVAAWAVWVGFTISLAVETVAAVRWMQAPRLAFAGPLQRWARVLVAAIVLAFSLSHGQPPAFASGPQAVQAQPFPQPVAHVVPVVEPAKPAPELGVQEESRSVSLALDPAGSAITVGRGDSAWGLAEHHLGDGMRWRELWELNHDRPQPDGGAWTDPQLIRPGWQLVLPNSETPQSSTTAEQAASNTYVVAEGDTLSGIAEAHLGDPDRYMEIADLNRDVVQPDGRRLTDPNLIIPGWRLLLPLPVPTDPPVDPAPAAETPAPAVTTPTPAQTEPPREVDAPAEASAPSTTTSTPAAVEPNTEIAVQPAPAAAPTATAQPDAPTSSPAVDDAADDESWLAATAPTLAGVSSATVLATGLLLRLRRARRRRLTRGAGGEATAVSAAERAIVAAADVPLVRWAGQSLSELMSRLRPDEATTSAPLAVELSVEAGIELLWDTPNPNAPAPWRVADEGWAWRLAYDPDAEAPVDALPAAIPALVTVGHREGRQLLVDLEAFGTLAVAGDAERVGDFLRSVALELSSGDDLADAYVVTVDVDGVEASDRLTAADIETARDRASSVGESVRAVLVSAHAPSSFAYRCGAGGAHLEASVVIIASHDSDAPPPLPTVGPRLGVALVASGDLPDAGARIDIASDGTATIDRLAVSFVAAGVPRQTAAIVEDLPTEESSDGDPGSNGHRARPRRAERLAMRCFNGDTPALFELPAGEEDADDGVDDPPTSPLDALLIVKVLGMPSVPDRPDLTRRQLILTVYLACRGRRVNASAVQDALWNGRAVQGKTVWNLVGSTRTALGKLPNGNWALTQSDRNRHVKGLDPAVTTDLAILRHLHDQAQNSSSSEAIGLLRQALALVEGPPFDADGYDWAHHGTQDVAEASRLIEQTAEQLVNLALDIDDVDMAREAIAQGLRGIPGDEVLYRLRMKTEHHAGNLTGVSAAYDELVRHLADYDADPSPSTIELRRELLGAARPPGG